MPTSTVSVSTVSRHVLKEMDSSIALCLEQVEQFRKDGFIRLKGVFSAQALNEYEQIITNALDEEAVNLAPLDQRDTYGRAFIQVENIWRRRPQVQQIVLSRRLGSIVTQLLGIRRIRLYHDHALYKEASGGITPWHADQRYWPLGTDLTMTVWIPLQATPQSMGSLEYAVGSQHLRFGRNLSISDDSEKQIAQMLMESDTQIVCGDYDLGEVSFHYGWTFHRASANTSGQTRKALSIMYYADGATVKAFENEAQQTDAKHFLHGALPGEQAFCELNPLLGLD